MGYWVVDEERKFIHLLVSNFHTLSITLTLTHVVGFFRYMHPVALGFFGGILPFGAIFIEMYFVFTAFWNYKFYYVYGFMLLAFIILTIVTVCVTIGVLCCFVLPSALWQEYKRSP